MGMHYRDIIRTAWQMAHSGRGLIWYGTIPTFFVTIAGVAYVVYQYLAFQASPFFGDQAVQVSEFVSQAISFATEHATFTTILTWATILVVIAYFVIPPFCEAGLIGLIAAIHRKKDVYASDGIAIGAVNFLKMLEYRLVLSVFSFLEFFTIYSLAIRNIGPSSWLNILFGVLMFISTLFFFLFIYGQNFIVLKEMGVITAISSSVKLVVGNLERTFLMMLLMLLIMLRVILNVFLLFLIPISVIFVTGFFVSKAALLIGVLAGGFVGLIVLLLAAYLAGVLHVFTTAVWTITFLNLEHDRVDRLLSE